MIDFDIKGKFQAKSKNKVGLDIGSYAVKMVEISTGPGKPALVGFGLKKVQGILKEALIDSIKTLAKESNIAAKEVNISVSGSSVITRFITMPKMKDEELKSAIKFEAEKFIPFNINDCIVDFQILKRDEKTNKLEVLLAAAKSDYVEERIKLVESCGFSVCIVDIDSFAVTNSFLKNYPTLDSDRTIALLNIGATLTNLSVMKGDTMCFARDIAMGGNDFNSAKTAFSNLLDEVKLSCSYYENQSGRCVDEFYLSGGCVGLTGLEECFQDVLGTKPILWNPMQFLDIDLAKMDREGLDKAKSSFGVAIGLSLR